MYYWDRVLHAALQISSTYGLSACTLAIFIALFENLSRRASLTFFSFSSLDVGKIITIIHVFGIWNVDQDGDTILRYIMSLANLSVPTCISANSYNFSLNCQSVRLVNSAANRSYTSKPTSDLSLTSGPLGYIGVFGSVFRVDIWSNWLFIELSSGHQSRLRSRVLWHLFWDGTSSMLGWSWATFANKVGSYGFQEDACAGRELEAIDPFRRLSISHVDAALLFMNEGIPSYNPFSQAIEAEIVLLQLHGDDLCSSVLFVCAPSAFWNL